MKTQCQINAPYCIRGLQRDKVLLKAKAPVLENTFEPAVAAPTESGVLSCPDFLGAFKFGCVSSFGRDGLVRKAGRMAGSMFSTSRPPAALENVVCGFSVQPGTETMTTTPASLRAAYALSQAHYALAKQVPDLVCGFTIATSYGDLAIPPGHTAKRIAALIEKMLRAELASAAKAAKQGGAA
jgi:hypothetical protein